MRAQSTMHLGVALLVASWSAPLMAQDEQVVLENQYVRVVRAGESASAPEKVLGRPVLQIRYANSRSVTSTDEGKTRESRKMSEGVRFSSSGRLPARESDEPALAVRIELKAAPPAPAPSSSDTLPALDPLTADPRHFRKVIDNASVRVLRVELEPHESTAIHVHPDRPALLVFPSGQTLRFANGADTAEEKSFREGDVLYRAGGARHTVENAGSQGVDFLVVELKGAPPR